MPVAERPIPTGTTSNREKLAATFHYNIFSGKNQKISPLVFTQ